MNSSYTRVSDHAKSSWSIIIAFVWGFAEATAFFIVPDVYLGFVALFNWRRGLSAMAATLIGAMLIVRHPRSAHPLDMPAGMLAVLCVGAALGTALTIVRL